MPTEFESARLTKLGFEIGRNSDTGSRLGWIVTHTGTGLECGWFPTEADATRWIHSLSQLWDGWPKLADSNDIPEHVMNSVSHAYEAFR